VVSLLAPTLKEPVEIFRMFLRELLRARDLGEDIVDEIKNYEWFHQHQSLWSDQPQPERSPEVNAAFEAHKLLIENVEALKIEVWGVRLRELRSRNVTALKTELWDAPRVLSDGPLAPIPAGDRRLGRLNVFGAVFEVHRQSRREEYESVHLVEEDALKVLAQITLEARPKESPPAATQSDEPMAANPAQAIAEVQPVASPSATQPNDPTAGIQAESPLPVAQPVESAIADPGPAVSGPAAAEKPVPVASVEVLTALQEPDPGGRPTDHDLLVAEAVRRLKETVPRHLSTLRRDMHKWLSEHPDAHKNSKGQIVSGETVEDHIRDVYRVAKEAERRLKAGGTIPSTLAWFVDELRTRLEGQPNAYRSKTAEVLSAPMIEELVRDRFTEFWDQAKK
jgi:hypothetical protein